MGRAGEQRSESAAVYASERFPPAVADTLVSCRYHADPGDIDRVEHLLSEDTRYQAVTTDLTGGEEPRDGSTHRYLVHGEQGGVVGKITLRPDSGMHVVRTAGGHPGPLLEGEAVRKALTLEGVTLYSTEGGRKSLHADGEDVYSLSEMR
ncbi:MAG: hypothetical protein SVU88_00720 [Candidatus Nanohaloarchaea archaeon]|nr:hypothetical protein [Candidatus Nanohaloarchaea archaeon]